MQHLWTSFQSTNSLTLVWVQNPVSVFTHRPLFFKLRIAVWTSSKLIKLICTESLLFSGSTEKSYGSTPASISPSSYDASLFSAPPYIPLQSFNHSVPAAGAGTLTYRQALLADWHRPEGVGEENNNTKRRTRLGRHNLHHPWDYFLWPQYSTIAKLIVAFSYI